MTTPTAVIYGLGPVGRSMAAIAPDGTVGVDIDPERVRACEALGGVASLREDPSDFDLAFVCVGTPNANGIQDASQVLRVLDQIALRPPKIGVAIRSTLLPQYWPGDYPVPVVAHPEFLRVRRSIRECLAPPFLVVGTDPQGATTADAVFRWWDAVGGIGCSRILCSIGDAILLKYSCNWFHAMKVEFANAVNDVAKEWGADGTHVMELLCQDTRLNISSAYLRPGGPFGGSCLPKDLEAAVTSLEDVPRILAAVLYGNHDRGEV